MKAIAKNETSSKIAQQIKVLAAKFDNFSLIPRFHVVGREN